jgi:formamidopyrimidine-DNA glycosylase
MPELPEVETMASDLRKILIGRRIKNAWIGWPKSVKTPSARKFALAVKGAKVRDVGRRGKNVLIYLDKDRLIVIHPKMTGHFLLGRWRFVRGRWLGIKKGMPIDRKYEHIRLIFELDNGEMLALSDVRKFAKVLFGSREFISSLPDLDNLGPEPLGHEFTAKNFIDVFKSQRRKVKQVLIDQAVIAGIGNIYADEILWTSKVSPLRRADSLSDEELGGIFRAMRSILAKAIELRGTSIRDFRDSNGNEGEYVKIRKVYGKAGTLCGRCGSKIKRIVIASRSTYLCPVCQRSNL